MSSRSVCTEDLEAELVPLPAIGTEISATVPAGLTSTSIGVNSLPLASELRFRSAIAAWTSAERTSLASTTTCAAVASPGNAAWILS